MPDHVKKILNRAYLEDKPYNDIVLHLEREMRLNGLGAPDETILVPLNAVDVAPTEPKKELTHRGSCFHCGKQGHYKAQYRKLRKIATTRIKHKMAFPTPMNYPNQSVTLVENSTKPRTAGTELMRRTTLGRSVTNSQSTSQISEQPIPTVEIQSKN